MKCLNLLAWEGATPREVERDMEGIDGGRKTKSRFLDEAQILCSFLLYHSEAWGYNFQTLRDFVFTMTLCLTHRRPSTTAHIPVRIQPILPLLLLPRHHHGLLPVIAKLQLRPARETDGALGGFAEDAQTHAADEPDVHDPPVAEAGGAEIDALLADAGG